MSVLPEDDQGSLRFPFGNVYGHQLPDPHHRDEQMLAWRRRVDRLFATDAVYTGLQPTSVADTTKHLDWFYDQTPASLVPAWNGFDDRYDIGATMVLIVHFPFDRADFGDLGFGFDVSATGGNGNGTDQTQHDGNDGNVGDTKPV